MSDSKEITTWTDFGNAVDSLTSDIQKSGFKPDCILAIARGGLLVAGALSYRLDIKNVQTVNVEHYVGNGLDDVASEEPRILSPGLQTEPLKDKRVLVVDDVTDSGDTIGFVSSLIGMVVEEQRSAVWFAKNRASIRPEFVASRTDHWVVFPWSPHSPEAHSQDQDQDQDASQ